MNVREIVQAGPRKIVKIFLVRRSKKRFSPGKQRLGVNADSRFVKFGFAIDIPPAQLCFAGQNWPPRTTRTGSGAYQSGRILVRSQRDASIARLWITFSACDARHQ